MYCVLVCVYACYVIRELSEMNHHCAGVSWSKRFFRFRPRFMDIDRIAPSWRVGYEETVDDDVEEVWDGDNDNECRRRRRRQVRHHRPSTFPIRDDVGYIGCLSDDEDEDERISDEDERISDEDEQSNEIMVLRRREMLFKNTVFVILGLIVFFILITSLTWWGGYRPPTTRI
jgi:hypothetical protein